MYVVQKFFVQKRSSSLTHGGARTLWAQTWHWMQFSSSPVKEETDDALWETLENNWISKALHVWNNSYRPHELKPGCVKHCLLVHNVASAAWSALEQIWNSVFIHINNSIFFCRLVLFFSISFPGSKNGTHTHTQCSLLFLEPWKGTRWLQRSWSVCTGSYKYKHNTWEGKFAAAHLLPFGFSTTEDKWAAALLMDAVYC